MDFGPALNVSLTSVRPALANSVALRCRFDCFYEKVIKVKADVAAP